MDEAVPLPGTAAPRRQVPPRVHHDVVISAAPSPAAAPARARARSRAGHRAARPGLSTPATDRTGTAAVTWVPYLVALAGAAAGLLIAWRGASYAALGTGVLGGSLLAAALARLILPERYAGLLATRRKASDVLTFAVLGAAVLAVALMLP